MGVSWVTDVHLGSRFFAPFLDTILHLFNVETGTINNAIYSHLYAFDGEFYTFSQCTNFHIGLCLCHNWVANFLCLLTLCSIESIISNSIVSTCDYYIDSACEI